MLAVLQFIAAGLFMIAGVVLFFVFAKEENSTGGQVAAIIILGVAFLHALCGYGLVTLKAFGRTIQVVFAGIGLLAVPIGTVISVLILMYLMKPEIKILFSGRDASQLTSPEVHMLTKFRESSSSGGVVVIGLVLAAFAVIALIGIVAAIAIPNLLNAVQRGKQKRTMSDIRSIAVACEAYAVDHNSYPDAQSISALKPLLEPKYIAVLPQTDAWQRPFSYASWNKDDEGNVQNYMIVSSGKDGILEHDNLQDYLPQENGQSVITHNYNNDIAFTAGSFVQYPE